MRKLGSKKKPDTPEDEQRITSSIAKILEVPESSIADVASIELTGNTEAFIDGCKGVIEYNENVVRLNVGRMVVKITGRGLQLRGMTAESAIVTGYILSLEYLS